MNNQFKQIHIITSLSKGGAEKMLYKILKHNINKSIMVICLSSRGFYSTKLENLNIKIVHLNLKSYSFINKLIILLKVLKFRSNSIIGWMYHGNIIALIIYFCNIIFFNKANLFWNIRQTLYNLDFEKKGTIFFIKLNKLFSFIPKKIIYNSKKSIDQHTKLGFYNKNNHYIPNGFVIKNNNQYNDKGLKLDLEISEKDIIISHINRFHPMKNHKLAFEITYEVLKKYNNVKFIFCGKGINLKNKDLKKIINLTDDQLNSCFFLDDIENVNKVLNISNLFLLTSSWGEAFPNIIGEAMLNSCNIIATDIGDVSTIIGDTNIVVPINSKLKIIEHIDLLLKSGKIYKKNIIAKKRIIENYNITKTVEQFNSII